jgi:hypothetical protein
MPSAAMMMPATINPMRMRSLPFGAVAPAAEFADRS